MDVKTTVVPHKVMIHCSFCGVPFECWLNNGTPKKYCSPRCREDAKKARKATPPPPPTLMTDEERTRMTELEELVDGCYTIVELYPTTSPAQKTWKQDWLDKAKRLVPSAQEW